MSTSVASHRLVRLRQGLRQVVAFLGVLGSASLLYAAPNDASATKLARDAIDVDYLSTNFAEAERKLRSAAALCGETACTPRTRARILRDLATVLIVGLHRAEDGKKTFAEALRADPAIKLEKALTTSEVEQIFLAAKSGGSSDAPSPSPASPSPAAQSTSTAAGGDMIHTPPPEQATLTPVPIYVELPDGVSAAKVVARYRAFGTSEWKTLALRRLGPGYGGEIACLDVGSTTGDLLYFVQATDAAGDVVAMSGTRGTPNKVVIKNAIAGPAPHLPGVQPPTRCADSADCPPGLPGCPADRRAAHIAGGSCERDDQCKPGLACNDGVCGAKTEPAEASSSNKFCDQSGECDSGEVCTAAHTCQRAVALSKAKRVQLSLNIGPDVSLVGSQADVCGTPQRLTPDQYTCIDQDGYAYKGVPQAGGPGTGNAVNGGPHLATTRLLVGLDYLLSDSFTVGTRVGYVFGVAPGQALSRLHAEARATLWLGNASFMSASVRPYLVVAGGLAQVDDKFEVPIWETDLRKGLYETQTLTVWRQSGAAFAGGGGGIVIPTGAGQRLVAELKVHVLFPNPGIAMAPSVGYALGL